MAEARERSLFIFPGQGTQYVGMGRDLIRTFGEARAVYDEASEALGYDVATLSREGPSDQLDRTEFTQPVLFTHAHACLTVLRALAGDAAVPGAAAGHSIGEYNALVTAGVLSFAEALRLVLARAVAMQTHGRGGLMALRADQATSESLAGRFYCSLAVTNSARQTVVGGLDADLDRLAEYTQSVERTVGTRLQTGGAFHTHLMVGAAEAFRPALDATVFRPPALKVLSNASGGFHPDDPDQIRASLFFQIFRPVRWRDCMLTALGAGYTDVVELGGGSGEGSDPAARRPRLDSLTRSAHKEAGVTGARLAGINVESLRATAEALVAESGGAGG